MIKIREAQREALRRDLARRFERRVAEHVHRRWRRDATAEAVLTEVRQAIARATQRGLQAENEIVAFTDLLFALGPAFEQQPWAAAILDDASLSAAERVALLYRRASEAVDV